jgi:hypothetical protein
MTALRVRVAGMESEAEGVKALTLESLTSRAPPGFARRRAGKAKAGPSPLGFQFFLGTDYPQMARNQVRDLAEKRIRTVAYICRA